MIRSCKIFCCWTKISWNKVLKFMYSENATKPWIYIWFVKKWRHLVCRTGRRGCTGKFLSEAHIFASTNPQYDDRLFIELRVQYMKIASSEHGENMSRTCCVHKLFFVCVLTFRTIFVHNIFYPCSAKRRASDKDLPVKNSFNC